MVVYQRNHISTHDYISPGEAPHPGYTRFQVTLPFNLISQLHRCLAEICGLKEAHLVDFRFLLPFLLFDIFPIIIPIPLVYL